MSAIAIAETTEPKSRLMRAATDLMWQQSYAAVSVEAICEKAAVKKGSFYYFFHSKSDLAIAALEAQWLAITPELERIFAPSVPPLERLQKYFEFIRDAQTRLYQKHGRVLGCAFGCLGSEFSAQNDGVCCKVREIMARTPRYFETALQDAAALGLIDPVDIPAQAQALFNYLEGVLLQARIQNDLEPVRRLPASMRLMIPVTRSARIG